MLINVYTNDHGPHDEISGLTTVHHRPELPNVDADWTGRGGTGAMTRTWKPGEPHHWQSTELFCIKIPVTGHCISLKPISLFSSGTRIGSVIFHQIISRTADYNGRGRL